MVEASALEQFEQAVRLDEQRKQEIALLLRELRDAHANDTERHKEIIDKLNYLEKLLTATYNLQYITYTLICGDKHADAAEANKLRQELEQRALERNGKEAQDKMVIRASASRDLKLQVEGDVIGGDKDEQKE